LEDGTGKKTNLKYLRRPPLQNGGFFLSAILNQEVIHTDEVIAKVQKWW
jgi:hypothetical protein